MTSLQVEAHDKENESSTSIHRHLQAKTFAPAKQSLPSKAKSLEASRGKPHTHRKALGNLSNTVTAPQARQDAKPQPSKGKISAKEGQRSSIHIPQIIAKTSHPAEKMEQCPERENMFIYESDEDDFEDIWPKETRISTHIDNWIKNLKRTAPCTIPRSASPPVEQELLCTDDMWTRIDEFSALNTDDLNLPDTDCLEMPDLFKLDGTPYRQPPSDTLGHVSMFAPGGNTSF